MKETPLFKSFEDLMGSNFEDFNLKKINIFCLGQSDTQDIYMDLPVIFPSYPIFMQAPLMSPSQVETLTACSPNTTFIFVPGITRSLGNGALAFIIGFIRKVKTNSNFLMITDRSSFDQIEFLPLLPLQVNIY